MRSAAIGKSALGSRRKDWIAANPETARKFVGVMLQVARWANTHQAESLKILGDVSKVTYPKNMHRAIYGETLDAALFQPVIDNAAKFGAISAPFPASELFAKAK